MLISTFYSIPNNNNLDYMEKLRTSLSRINVNNSTTVCLGGDFNLGDINWATHSLYPGATNVAMSNLLIEIAEQFKLEQMVTKPTREDRILVLFSHLALPLWRLVVYPGISDHDGITLIDMLTSSRFIKTKPRKLYEYDKANHDELEKRSCQVEFHYYQ